MTPLPLKLAVEVKVIAGEALIGTQALCGYVLGFMSTMIASPALVTLLVLHDEVYQKYFIADTNHRKERFAGHTLNG